MNVFSHTQFFRTPALVAWGFSILLTISACLGDDAVPSTSKNRQQVQHEVVAKRDKGLGKFFGRTMKTTSLKKKRTNPLPLYNKRGEVKNDIATRLRDPQRKESPIRTARLFKIPIEPTVVVEEKVISGSAAAVQN